MSTLEAHIAVAALEILPRILGFLFFEPPNLLQNLFRRKEIHSLYFLCKLIAEIFDSLYARSSKLTQFYILRNIAVFPPRLLALQTTNPSGIEVELEETFIIPSHGLQMDLSQFEIPPLLLSSAKGKGLGLFSRKTLPANSFVLCYCGEYLTSVETRKRQLSEYDEKVIIDEFIASNYL